MAASTITGTWAVRFLVVTTLATVTLGCEADDGTETSGDTGVDRISDTADTDRSEDLDGQDLNVDDNDTSALDASDLGDTDSGDDSELIGTSCESQGACGGFMCLVSSVDPPGALCSNRCRTSDDCRSGTRCCQGEGVNEQGCFSETYMEQAPNWECGFDSRFYDGRTDIDWTDGSSENFDMGDGQCSDFGETCDTDEDCCDMYCDTMVGVCF